MQRVDVVLLEQLADERRDVHPGGGHRPSSSGRQPAMRMAVAFYVTGISTPEVHPKFPPLPGTLPEKRQKWFLLAYRLPREPSTPRIAVWRRLKRLGVAQLLDGLVTLPLDARNKEQLEWVADQITEAGGHASIWLGHVASKSDERSIVGSMAEAVA